MADELADIKAFVKAIPPFDRLPEDRVSQLIKLIEICYIRRAQLLPPADVLEPRLYILRKGSLSYLQVEQGQDDELLGKFTEGEICALYCQSSIPDNVKVIADEDCLIYSMSYQAFKQHLQGFPQISDFFSASSEQRLQQEVSQLSDDAKISAQLMDTTIEALYQGPAATIECDITITQAAQRMTELNFSSLLVTDNSELVGIVTDKDIRKRCVAEGISPSEKVDLICTRNLLSIETDKNAFDALILMNTKGIHHLPVMHNGHLVGMITSTDLMNKEGQNAVHLTGAIRKAEHLEALVEVSSLIPKLQQRMAKRGTTANHVGKHITAITNGITSRLIELAEKKYGSAPMAYAWVVAGSQARHEQMCHTDQDNGIILAQEPSPEQDVWFANMAKFVCDGLASCGYIYCPGDIMATNPQWRVSQARWHQYFNSWVTQPTPQALLESSVFFDLSFVHGDVTLLQQVRDKFLAKTKANTLLQSHLSRNALSLRPPLGFFRDFVLVSKGENKDTLDLKHSGIAPIIELARIYSLSLGIDAVNTLERLQKAAGSSMLTQASAESLIDAFEFLGALRLRHQARQINNADPIDNYLPPKDISKLEREHLKDAFKVIKTLQDARQKDFR
jgi:CBS domain-containing protein